MAGDTFRAEILEFVTKNPGHSDDEINARLFERAITHQHVNSTCRLLAEKGLIRRERFDGRIRNYPVEGAPGMPSTSLSSGDARHSGQTWAPLAATTPAPKAEDIVQRIRNFVITSQEPCHRYLSWDNCYNFLSRRDEIRHYEALANFAALHLAWFLASWGMLRGGKLIWKNHLFLAPVVKVLMRPEYDGLLGLVPTKDNREQAANALFGRGGLVEDIRGAFSSLDATFQPSDILVTKVILGSLGCCMAYDRYVTTGLGQRGLTSRFGQRSFLQAADFYLANKTQFDEVSALVDGRYPPFKLLDMYFFELGIG